MIFIYQLFHGLNFQASLSHAIICILMMFLIHHYLEYEDILAEFSLVNSLIYFGADLCTRFNWSKLFHHLVSMLAIGMALTREPEVIRYVAIGSGILEFSGPFWTCLRLRIEKSNEIPLPIWYNKTIAGMIFMVVFFFNRFIWFNYHVIYNTPESIPRPLVWLIFLPFTGLHIYWSYLLIKGFIKQVM